MQRIGSTMIAETQNSDVRGGRVSNAHPNGVETIGSSSSISMRKGHGGNDYEGYVLSNVAIVIAMKVTIVIISMVMRTVRNHMILRLRSYIAHTFRDSVVIE